MSAAPNGGPAFPYAFHLPDAPGEPSGVNLGMSLRDWFAGKALQGWLASYAPETAHPAKRDTADDVATEAYAMADAMLRARAKP